jgi:hypothetical protein
VLDAGVPATKLVAATEAGATLADVQAAVKAPRSNEHLKGTACKSEKSERLTVPPYTCMPKCAKDSERRQTEPFRCVKKSQLAELSGQVQAAVQDLKLPPSTRKAVTQAVADALNTSVQGVAQKPRKTKRTAWWFFHGAKDDVVPPQNSIELADHLKKHSNKVRISIYPEANHNSWDSAFAEPELLPWLFSHKR